MSHKTSNLTPIQKRNLAQIELDEFSKREKEAPNDFAQQRLSYVSLNSALSIINEHDAGLVNYYQQNIKEIEKISNLQDQRATYAKSEDSGKQEMMPHEADMHWAKFFKEKNPKLASELNNSLEMMKNEAKLYDMIRYYRKEDSKMLVSLGQSLQDGAMFKNSDEPMPIDAKRFKTNYPEAIKKLKNAQKELDSEKIKQAKKGKER